MTTPRDDRTEAPPTTPIPVDPAVPVPRDTHDPAVRPEPARPGGGQPGGGQPGKIRRTRISGTWVAVLASVVVLIFLLVFVLQNPTGVTIHFLGFSGTLPLGVALLFGAIAGAVLVGLVGAARIMQLRRQAKRGLH
ncbi:lipopolysaccharide assembly LapA domain-containing protein [Saccharothrix longispora]|uniref:LapA family protein n=1 Tax=Saccharothrix longispora TaxID=33920 RepID=UPI0028FD7AF0|nr:lipopolysaccharide assembly protein LapA domain-containing protein [Saccharothrix longispora]MDU0290470.1 lipopolysaccharide assembly protein LapA domain-containing protein [Saccharothrix longispora]